MEAVPPHPTGVSRLHQAPEGPLLQTGLVAAAPEGEMEPSWGTDRVGVGGLVAPPLTCNWLFAVAGASLDEHPTRRQIKLETLSYQPGASLCGIPGSGSKGVWEGVLERDELFPSSLPSFSGGALSFHSFIIKEAVWGHRQGQPSSRQTG